MVHRKTGRNRNEKVVLAYVKNQVGNKYKKNSGALPLTAMVEMKTGERVHVEFGVNYDDMIFNNVEAGDGIASDQFNRITHFIGVKIA